MKRMLSFLAVTVVLAVASARAGTVVLTFEGLKCEESVANLYNNGLGGSGSGPGPNHGITFSAASLALQDAANCPQFGSNISNLPSPVTGLFFLSGEAATMDVAAGFNTGFSFFYAAPYFGGSVKGWSGLDDTGTLLATLNLPTTAGCSSSPNYCIRDPVGVSFSGTAQSVDFGGSANYIVFDNITLGASTPGGAAPTPEPATVTLFGSGLLGLFRLVRRRKS